MAKARTFQYKAPSEKDIIQYNDLRDRKILYVKRGGVAYKVKIVKSLTMPVINTSIRPLVPRFLISNQLFNQPVVTSSILKDDEVAYFPMLGAIAAGRPFSPNEWLQVLYK